MDQAQGHQAVAETDSISGIQELNLSLLLAVKDAAHAGMAQACCSFGLTVEQVECIQSLKPTEVFRFVVQLGDQALFSPREDLAELLAVPEAALPLIAASRRRLPARPSDTACGH